MSNNKIQELTEHLYEEGLSKGRLEAEKLVNEAQAQAEKILSEARQQAASIVDQAKAKAEDIAAKAQSDIKTASAHALDATKTAIQNAILAKSADAAVGKVMGEEEFAKEFILAVAKSMGEGGSDELSVILPESLKELSPYVTSQVSKAIGKNIEVKVGKNIKGGLNIGPKDGSYYISLSDETFTSLIREYLRPATRKLLFGE